MSKTDELCVTIYIPTSRAGAETQQGRIRLKNILREAELRLVKSGMKGAEAELFLAPAEDLIYNVGFWQEQRDGLAIFLARDMFYYYSLPLKLHEFLFIGNHFHLKPLLPLLSGDGLFYLLALSQNDVRVLQCTRASVKELELDDIPHSLAEAMKYDDPERQLQWRTNNEDSTDPRSPAIFHGHGVGVDDAKNNILRYFQLIDRGLHHLLRDEHAPLILAGVDFLIPIYRQANRYRYLVEESIPGNPEELSAEDLQTLAWPLVEHYFHQAEQEALEYYGPFKGTGKTTNELVRAVPAAANGQVEILFLADGAHQWGRYDAERNEVDLHEQEQMGDEDLFDFAAIHTLINGGKVFLMDAQKMPDGDNMAALLRY